MTLLLIYDSRTKKGLPTLPVFQNLKFEIYTSRPIPTSLPRSELAYCSYTIFPLPIIFLTKWVLDIFKHFISDKLQ